MAERENIINRLLAIAWTKKGGRLWRITPGLLWAGRVTEQYTLDKQRNGTQLRVMEMINPRPIKMFKSGMPDNIGFEMVEITPDMVGKSLPVFCMVEAKTKRYPRISDEQRDKLSAFAAMGVRCYVAREAGEGYELEEWT